MSTQNPLDAIVVGLERDLKQRILAGGPLAALEMDATMNEFRRVATAQRLVVERASDVTDPQVQDAFHAQLAKEAATLVDGALLRVDVALRKAADLWRVRMEAIRRREEQALRFGREASR